MAGDISMGKAGGLPLAAEPSAAVGTVLLWALLSAIGVWLLNLSPGEAIAAGLAATLLHWVSVVGHQLGHAWAARRTGHPMTGTVLWGVLSRSLYPPDEPPLPGPVHIQRALGGPKASLLITVVAGAILLLLPQGGTPWWVGFFFFLDNLLTFTLGSFLPLGFTDGSTILEWRGKS